jgi:hypothetical protein
MGRYPEAEDRDSAEITNPDSTVVDLESYRRRRETAGRDTSANRRPRDAGQESAGALNAPVEGNRKD